MRVWIGIALVWGLGVAAFAETATGVVFHDKDGDGRFGKGDKLLKGIKVSNGRDIVKTDKRGSYTLEVDGETVLFVLKPTGWRTPLSADKLPLFYYVHRPAGSEPRKYAGIAPTGPLPASVDFALYPQKEPKKFRAVLFADPQTRDQREIDYVAHDVVESLIGIDAAFGVTLGDILFDDLSLFGSMNRTVGLIGIPWYNVVGNHDIDRDVTDDFYSNDTFTSVYGPPYYSFDYGQAHFLVLDNVEWHGPTQDKKKGHYRSSLGPAQLEFVRRDLALVPQDQLVVLLMHVPLNDMDNRQELYRLIEERPFTLSFSGHTHYQEHRFIGAEDGWRGKEPHHHIVTVTVSGSWWSGAPDERGIPHTIMRDGAPNGYALVAFDGRDYTFDFRAASAPDGYQMNVLAPEVVGRDTADQVLVRVNVFAGSERSTVEMALADEWMTLMRVPQRDPYFEGIKLREAKAGGGARPLRFSHNSSHIWQGALPTGLAVGTHLLRVRSLDMFGRRFETARVIRIE
jgi:hypothetical protein